MKKKLLYTLLILFAIASTITPCMGENVSRTENAVYQLAQKRVAIQSPATGKFLKNIGTSFAPLYGFRGTSSGDAAHFYLKPVSLGNYLLTNSANRYLTSIVPSTETHALIPSPASEWNISAQEVGSNNFHFRIKNRLTQHPIQNEYWGTETFLFFQIPVLKREQHFKLVEQNDNFSYPEIAVNVSGDRNKLKGDVNKPVRGFVDAHAHITSYEFMGGNVVHGEAFHKYGVPYALPDSAISHGPNGSLDLIGNIFTFGDPLYTYNTKGWPDFTWWPNSEQMTHTGYYYKWIERAWLSGERIMVTHLVENKVLCEAQRSINPAGWVGKSCDTMDSIRRQMSQLRELEAYIDAQQGGPGKGFFHIVTTPEEARQTIADGRLAVLVGVEVSELFNCGELDYCSTDTIEDGLMELYDLGIRSLFIAHKFDNQLAGAVLEEGFINIGEALSTGHYYETRECDDFTSGKTMSAGLPVLGDVPFVADLLDQTGVYPSYDQSIEHHCNIRRLSPLGEYLVNRMIDLGMIIELDHLGADSITDVIDIAEDRNYSGLVSGHNFFPKDRNGNLHENFKRMLRLGGFSARYNVNPDAMETGINEYLTEVEKTPFLNSVGLGTDMSALGGQPGPIGNVNTPPVQYSFTTEFGLTFDRQVSGNRTFDINQDGMAHYGLLPDHVQALKLRGNTRIYEALMNSAEGYLQMWERCMTSNTPVIQETPVAFKTAHGKYLVAEKNGGATVNANRTAIGPWESFHIISNGDLKDQSRVTLKTGNGHYFSAQPGGALDANRTAIGSWEKFTLINHSNPGGHVAYGDVISLKGAHNTYVVAESNGSANANRHAIGAWEKFMVLFPLAQAAAPTGSNLAHGKPTSQSSLGWGGVSSRAVDGNTSGNWGDGSVTHTNAQAGAWWRVALGAAHQVNTVTLWNRTDCCSERLSNFHVDLLDANDNVITTRNYSGTAGVKTDISISAGGVYAVRVQLNGNNYLSLAEVQVFGNPVAPSPPTGSQLLADQTLTPGMRLSSQDKRFNLNMQSDGNLVLYQNGSPLWATNTNGRSVARAIMQADGNLVLYDPNGRPIWASHTHGNPGARLVIQNDGNLVIYSASNKPLWASNTCCR